jgi:conjugative transfer signal peptidase TraF
MNRSHGAIVAVYVRRFSTNVRTPIFWGTLLVALALFLGVVPAALGWAGVRRNISASVPLGYYLARPLVLRRGELVFACLPPSVVRQGRALEYLHEDRSVGTWFSPVSCPDGVTPVLKRIGALAGDQVYLMPEYVMVVEHGESVRSGIRLPHSATKAVDSRGRALEHYPWGRYEVQQGEVWLFADHPDSWDGRYTGPLPTQNISARAVPLWTW